MSAAMLRQMLEEAGAFLKEEKYQQALESARRVSQFDTSNFQALMCVGLASYHLKQWEDSETALRRAAELKPELPAAWKNLVDLFEASGDATKKIEALEKLIGVFRKGNKVKPSQKWIAELATTAMGIKAHGKAFDAWYSLVNDADGLSIDTTPNEELPSSLEIWLQLVDLVQLPTFSLSDAAGDVSMDSLLDGFVAVAQRWDWSSAAPETGTLRSKTDIAFAMFIRHQINQIKTLKPGPGKHKALKKLDVLTTSIVSWFPFSKLPAEYLLLRSEDNDSPIDEAAVTKIAEQLGQTFSKSPMALMYQGFASLKSDSAAARALLIEGLASCSASSFHESALCIRAQVELASLALDTRDVEGCLSRLQKAREVVHEKSKLFGCGPPNANVYSDVKARLLEARAHDLAGAVDTALEIYNSVISETSGEDRAVAVAGAAELLCATNRPEEAIQVIDESVGKKHGSAQISCTRAWAKFLVGELEESKEILVESAAKITVPRERATALKRLAIVYWNLGGTLRSDKQTCFANLLQAAKLAPNDGDVFAWLGQWYNEVGSDVMRAEKCFLKALSLAPLNEMAGVALSNLYEQQGKTELNVKLWTDLTSSPESAPTWALLRLAQHLVNIGDEAAVSKLHLVLRNEPLNSSYWVAMGHVYCHFGKLVAAQRSYLRAIELGEVGWCVLTELARIEGRLLMFEDALQRVDEASKSVCDTESAHVIATVYAELLFDEAKYLNGEGLYGRAAANIKRAAQMLSPVAGSTSTLAMAPLMKLLGDIYSFAFYLSPLNFMDTENGWLNFLAEGKNAYDQVAESLSSADLVSLAQAHYDIGVNCWYQARASFSINGKAFNPFIEAKPGNDDIHDLLQAAREHLSKSITYDPAFGLAWNALGVVSEHPLTKQLAWIRAIQTSSLDAAWANLGMLYVHHQSSTNKQRTAELAREAFLHLQAINPNNPAMWIGYGMIYLSQHSGADRRMAREAFQCALEMGYHMDALQGLVVSTVLSEHFHTPTSDDDKIVPTREKLLFAIKKYLEREPFDPHAWSLLSLVQVRLGHLKEAAHAANKCLEMTGEEQNAIFRRNSLIISGLKKGDSSEGASAATKELLQTLSDPTALKLVEAQHAFISTDGAAALMAAKSALSSDALPDSKRGAVAMFALALSALETDNHAAAANELADAALAAIIDRSAVDQVSLAELEVVDLYYRHIKSTAVDTLVAPQRNSPRDIFTAARRALFLVDSLTPSALSSQISNSPSVANDECLHWEGIKCLLTSNSAGDSPMKLVRADPTNPYAYGIAALQSFKLAVLSDADQCQAFQAALRLLTSGLLIAKQKPSSADILLHWAYALIARHTAEDNASVVENTEAAYAAIRHHRSSGLSPVNALLWEARVLSVVNDSSAIAKYADALKLVSKDDSALTILYELGGVCESFGLLDAAHHVWKTVAAIKTSDSESLNLNPGCIGNLRLAIVHATKQNAKSAKKFAKTAVALAGVDGSHDSDVASTARFVESVIASM